MNDVMFDIETLGMDPNNSWMFCFGAVKFDLEDKLIGDSKLVYLQADGRNIDSKTLSWWLDTDAPLLANLMKNVDLVKDNDLQLEGFVDWLEPDTCLWAAPIQFDIPFLFSYLQESNINHGDKINRRRIIDCRSFALGRNKEFKRVHVESDAAHNPVNDCISQIKGIFNCI